MGKQEDLSLHNHHAERLQKQTDALMRIRALDNFDETLCAQDVNHSSDKPNLTQPIIDNNQFEPNQVNQTHSLYFVEDELEKFYSFNESPLDTVQQEAPMKHAAPSEYKTSTKRKRKRRGLWNALFIASFVIFLGSVGYLGFLGFSYWNGQAQYDELEQIALPKDTEITPDNIVDRTIDWDALRAINPDVIGWIYVPDTQVNYPLVVGRDNEYYLTHDFRKNPGMLTNFGTIFMDKRNTDIDRDENTLLYGHHMNNGSMFAFIDTLFRDNNFNKHRTIYILTPDYNYRLETFALIHCDHNEPLIQPNFSTKEDRIKYLDNKIDRNVVKPSPEIKADDIKKFFTLVTCDNVSTAGREALFATVVDRVAMTGPDKGRVEVIDPALYYSLGDTTSKKLESVDSKSKEYE